MGDHLNNIQKALSISIALSLIYNGIPTPPYCIFSPHYVKVLKHFHPIAYIKKKTKQNAGAEATATLEETPSMSNVTPFPTRYERYFTVHML